MNVIEVRDLNFSYQNTKVLTDVSFKISNNAFTVIIGPNGGGKSTLLKLMLGLLSPDSGEVRILGEDINRVYSRIGYVPQDLGYIKDFPITVIDTVLMGMYASGLHKKQRHEQAEKYLDTLGMLSHKNRRLNELSTGQRQRVLLARAMVNEPALLFLDEPISGVDPNGQKIVLEVLSGYQKNGTVLFVSHNLEMIPAYATSVLCVERKVYFHSKDDINRTAEGCLSLVRHDRNCEC